MSIVCMYIGYNLPTNLSFTHKLMLCFVHFVELKKCVQVFLNRSSHFGFFFHLLQVDNVASDAESKHGLLERTTEEEWS